MFVAVGARLPPRLPEDLVAAEEGEVDGAGVVTSRLDVRSLLPRPVLVVADRQEDLVLQDLAAAAVGVDTGEVADVVPVLLQPAHHRVLGVEQPVLGRGLDRVEGPVVADLVRATGSFVAAGAVAPYRLLPPQRL